MRGRGDSTGSHFSTNLIFRGNDVVYKIKVYQLQQLLRIARAMCSVAFNTIYKGGVKCGERMFIDVNWVHLFQ